MPDDPGGILEWIDAVRIVPVSGAEWEAAPEWDIQPRRVSDAMWFWIAKGTAWARVGDSPEKHVLHRGDLLVVPRGMVHEVYPAPGCWITQYATHFYAQLFGTVDLLTVLGMQGRFPGSPDAPYEACSRQCAREYAVKASGWRQAMVTAIWQVLFHIIRFEGERLNLSGIEEKHQHMARLRPAFNLIDDRLDDPSLKVADLARAVHVGETRLRRLFRQGTQMTPVEFIRRRRTEKACALLRTTDMNAKAIAARCGFSDPAFLYRTFRRLTGQTPRGYREMKEM
jgi:AraC-like DNA-binding protein